MDEDVKKLIDALADRSGRTPEDVDNRLRKTVQGIYLREGRIATKDEMMDCLL
ncbi:MAG: hypothetical protein LBQ91_00350 [Oscillospiraceae bacterium]|jgi:hypothetical protein|nr:hypothetical protein [Oscillospiraceae bacterium]